jgi:hypothetical protein
MPCGPKRDRELYHFGTAQHEHHQHSRRLAYFLW